MAIETEINITPLEKSYKFNLNLIESVFHSISLGFLNNHVKFDSKYLKFHMD